MTPTELRKIRSELFNSGLVAYFEYGEFANHSSPDNFLAVDRKSLSDAMEPIDERGDWEAVIVASYKGW
ncbi:hypothetical protein PENARI_c034G12313 [Penicillium arizonense]|uniref:Uncharacterized protein n=1 Tax=Penicillium arizonense TaxID=1835702 RepID=A0A1F5L417_PENAI|nr:hypothetical protein PENARI_c034G12313 [Penicillium arizonense]OGE47978.1 hypothetical protein PENARI_c034G12313 [Penicillium arizonense]